MPFAEQRSDLRAGIGRRVGQTLDESPGLWRLTSSEQPDSFVRRTEFESVKQNFFGGPIWGPCLNRVRFILYSQ
jgi:hypothetical protein